VVFKIGYVTNARYAAWDVGDSVIYYPPRQELEPEEKKEIQISVKVRINNIIKNRNRKVNKTNDDTTKKYTITIVMQRLGGIRMSYSAKVRIKKMELGGDRENGLAKSMAANDDSIDNNKENLLVPISKENDKMTTTKIESLNKPNFCNDCKIQIVFEPPTRKNIQMELQGYFLTSEYIKILTIKINDNSSSDGNGYIWLKGELNQGCKIADVFPRPTLVWECTSGSFPCGNNDEFIIYLTPSENELSKSPVTITLYTFYNVFDHGNASGSEPKKMIDNRRIWLFEDYLFTAVDIFAQDLTNKHTI
jgi:hypothetical protein